MFLHNHACWYSKYELILANMCFSHLMWIEISLMLTSILKLHIKKIMGKTVHVKCKQQLLTTVIYS
jgi:hypothetical protein